MAIARSQRTARFALGATLAVIYSTLGVVRPIVDWLRERDLLKPTVAAVFAAAALAALVVAARARERRAALLTATFASPLYAAVATLMTRPEERLHLLEYSVVAFLSVASLPRLLPQRLLLALAMTAAFGWVDECIQGLLPSRHYDLRDVAFNGLAGLLAIGLLALHGRLSRPMVQN